MLKTTGLSETMKSHIQHETQTPGRSALRCVKTVNSPLQRKTLRDALGPEEPQGPGAAQVGKGLTQHLLCPHCDGVGSLRRLDKKQVQEPSQAPSPLGVWRIRKLLSVPLVELGFRVPGSSTTQGVTECRVVQQGRRQAGAPARKKGKHIPCFAAEGMSSVTLHITALEGA